MSGERKTAIATGGSQGIGAGLVKAFLERGYHVVANSRKITKSGAFEESDEVALVDGNIAEPATAAKLRRRCPASNRSMHWSITQASSSPGRSRIIRSRTSSRLSRRTSRASWTSPNLVRHDSRCHVRMAMKLLSLGKHARHKHRCISNEGL
jgi:hypothetical protein